MKYLVFVIVAFGVLPFAFVLSLNRKWLKYAFWGILLAMCLYLQTSINFFSMEDYRGSARGMEVSLAYLMAFAIIGALIFSRRFRNWIPDWGCGCYLIYFLLCLPSLMAAENLLIAWFEVWKMIMLYFFYIAVYNYLRATDDLRMVIATLAVFTIVNMLFVVKLHFNGVYQPNGVFPHQNCMAMAMHLLGALFFAAYMMHGLRSRFSLLCSMAFLCALMATIRSYSRMAMALVPVNYGMVFLLCVFKDRPRRWFLRIFPVAVLGLLILAIMLPRIIERFETAPKSSADTRVELALCAWEMIKDEPWRGVGINNWGLKINLPYEYADRAGRITNYQEDYADGVVETVYLLVCAECGIPAFLAMLVWFGWYLVKCWGLMRRFRRTEWFFVPTGILVGLGVIYVQSCLEWVLRQQLNLICLMFVFAIISYLDRKTPERIHHGEALSLPEGSSPGQLASG